MFGMCFCLSYAGKQKLYGYIQMRPGDDLRLCYQVHNEEYSKKLAVYNLAVGYYLLFLLFCFDALFFGSLADESVFTAFPCFHWLATM